MYHLLLQQFYLTFIIIIISYVWYLFIKNPGIIDVVWPILIATSASIYFVNQNVPFNIYWYLIIFWASRLCFFLFTTRILASHVEKRYFELQKKWRNKSFLLHFCIQGLLANIIASCFYFISKIDSLI